MMSTLPPNPPNANWSFFGRFRRDLLPASTEGKRAVERRRFPRQTCRSMFALCQEGPETSNELRAGQVRDMSVEGLGLILSRPYSPGTELAVELQDPAGWVKGVVRVRVVHVSHDPGEHWLMGCTLLGEVEAA